jgi:hypothetical protein
MSKISIVTHWHRVSKYHTLGNFSLSLFLLGNENEDENTQTQASFFTLKNKAEKAT